MTFTKYFTVLVLLSSRQLFASQVSETVQAICDATTGVSSSSAHFDARLTITRRPTYDASWWFVFDSYEAKMGINFEEHSDLDRWTMKLIDTTTSEVFMETSSKLGPMGNDLLMKVRTPDQSKVIELNCKLMRL